MVHCIFCDNELRPDTTEEHILHNCLGGRETTAEVICSQHNNGFGGTIDEAFAAPLLPIRNLMQFKSGSGDPPPKLRGLQAGEDKINICPTGKVQLASSPIKFRDAADGNLDATITTEDPAVIKKMIAHIANRYGLSVAEVEKQITSITLTERRASGPVAYKLGVGGPDPLRSMLKSCLVLFARHVGNDVVKGDNFKDARGFVLQGGEQFQLKRIRLDTCELPGAQQIRDRFSSFFNLIYVKSNEDGRVLGHFTFYNMLSWRFVLCARGGPKHCRFALANNPGDPAIRTRDASELPDIPFSWLDADRPITHERMRKRLEEMEAIYKKRVIASEFDRIVDDTVAQCELTYGDNLSDEFVGRLVQRAGLFAVGLPYEEALSPDAIAKLLSGKPRR